MNYLNEDNIPQNFLVKFSAKLAKKIKLISEYNHNNIEGVNKWLNYIDWIKSYISKRSIAWDYANQHIELPNGTRFIRKFNIGYTVKTDSQGAYVYVFMIDLKIEEYGLTFPDTSSQNYNQKATESNFMSSDEYSKILLECYDRYLHNLLYWGK